MTLDVTPLGNAVARLDEGWARYAGDPADTLIRDGLIQRFAFTYDLAHKLLRRALEADAANPEEVDRMSFPTLIRTGIEQGLVPGDWPAWRTFREMRALAAHAHDDASAGQVAAAIPGFLAEVRRLRVRLLVPSSVPPL